MLKSSHTSDVMSRINDITCITYDLFTSLERTGLRRHGIGNGIETHINEVCHISQACHISTL